jgi:1-acyl-sn-glycerol-3-phosphate acyltransferase
MLSTLESEGRCAGSRARRSGVDGLFYWFMKRIAAGPLLRGMFRPWVRGLENIPSEGGAILASNHLAVIDSFVLPLVVSRKILFIAKAEYFTGTGIKGRLKAGFFRGIGSIPVDRGGGKAGEAALRKGLEVLQSGNLFGIYPEGTRSPDGRLYRGKTGVARLALESGAPVVPVAMIGTDEAQPIGQVIPKPMRIGIVIGEPLDFSRYKGMENDRFILRSVTDEIMYALMTLSGQEYVDIYAATAKARIAAGHASAEETPAPDAAHAPGGRPVPDVQVPVPPQDEGTASVG